MTAADTLAPVTELVGHLRARAGALDPSAGDLASAELIADPDHLAAVVAATGDGRGSTDPQVLASLWWQAYAYRVGGTVLAAWALGGAAPDPSATPDDPAGIGVTVARSRPAGLVVAADAAVLADLDELVDRLFTRHLEPLAMALRARHSLGERLVWGNVAAGFGAALGAVASAPGAPDVRPAIAQIRGALPHDVDRLGDWQPDTWDFQRTTCCLWWKTTVAAGSLCADCSLTTAPEGTLR